MSKICSGLAQGALTKKTGQSNVTENSRGIPQGIGIGAILVRP